MITEALKARRDQRPPPQAGQDCPSDGTLVAYLDGGLDEDGHRVFEGHLAACDWCMERVGLLGRVGADELVPDLPDITLARACKLVPDATRKRFSRVPAWAAAAGVLLALGLVIVQPLNPPGQSPGDPDAAPLRSIDPAAMSPDALSAGDGIQVVMQPGRLDWTPVSGSLFYQVTIVTDAGDPVWEEQVAKPGWPLPSGLHLDEDSLYFVQVQAYLSETQAVNSEFEPLTPAGMR